MNKDTKKIMDKQRHDRQQKEQYDNVVGLGWKNLGIAFLIIILLILIYGIFFN